MPKFLHVYLGMLLWIILGSASVQMQTLHILRCHGPGMIRVGASAVFTIEVNNHREVTIPDVVMQCTLPEGLAYLGCNIPSTTVRGRDIIWNIGQLPPIAVKRFEVSVRGERMGLWNSTISVESRESPPIYIQYFVTVYSGPEVYIVGKAPQQVRLGQKIRYDLTVKSDSTSVARDVVIHDTIPAGLKYQDKTTGTSLRWDIGNLSPGEIQTRSYTVEAIQTGTFTNQPEVWVRGQCVHRAESTEDTATTTVVAPDLRIAPECQPSIYIHRCATCIIRVTNEGSGSAKGVEVTETIPSDLSYVESDPPGMLVPAAGERPATVRWDLGEIPPHSMKSVSVVMRGVRMGICRHTSTLVCKTDEPPQVPRLETSCDLEIRGVPQGGPSTYDTEDPVEVGKNTIYVSEVRNEGSRPGTNVIMRGSIPKEMEFVAAQGPSAFRYDTEKRQVVFEPVPVLPPGEKLVYRVTCKAITPGSAKYAAIFKYDQFDREILDEEGTSVYK